MMTKPIELRFWCNEHEFVEAGFGEPITEVHFNQRGELGLACPLCFKSRPMTILRYTGVDDENGTKVFEGDIVELYDGDRHVVQYQDRWGGYELAGLYDRDTLGDKTSDWSARVIGNIYKNKELLK